MTEQENPTVITPELKNEYLTELRDIEGYLSIIAGAEESIKEITADAKEKYGISSSDMKAIAKSRMNDKLSEELVKLSNKADYMEIAKEPA